MAKAHTHDAVPAEGPVAPTDSEKKPTFGTPKPSDPAGELPRVVKELERAAPGTVRLKVSVENWTGMNKPRYILAKPGDEAGAKAVYLKASGIGEQIERLKKGGVTEIEQPLFVVKQLAD